MASYNKVILMGNLTRDPELRYTPSGAPICSFGLAVNQKYKVNDEWRDDTCFVDISVWNRQGENCNQYLAKGRPVLVDGKLKFSSWTAPDGQKRSKLEVVANSVTFLGTNQGGAYESTQQQGSHDSNQQQGGAYNSNNQQQQGGGYNNNPQQGGYNNNTHQNGGGYSNNAQPNRDFEPQQGGNQQTGSQKPGADEPPFPSDDEIPF